MTLARFNLDSCPPEKPAADTLNVIILYDRLADISKASAKYLQLTRDLPEFSPDFRLWRVDLTLEPEYCFEAERDFAEADVIIVAVDGHQKCPPEFLRWKDGAGHEGGPGPHAVIALLNGTDASEHAAETWGGLLHDATPRIDPDVLVWERASRK